MISRPLRRKIRRLAITATAVSAFTILVGPFLIPVPALKDAYPPQTLGDPDSQFIEINRLSVHVKTSGEGEKVFVLMHGFGASVYTWHAVTKSLCLLGRVIAYDRTGFGLSAHPIHWRGENPYTPEAQVEQVKGLLDHFGVKQAILVGNSAGGTIALRTALVYPERVAALILADPAVYIGSHAPRWLHPLLATPQMRHLGPLIARQLMRRGTDLLKIAWHDPALISPEMRKLYTKPFLVENWDKALWEITLASHQTGLVEHLGEIKIPTLVITGEDDRIVPTTESIRLAKELPNAELVVIPEVGHIPQEEKPEEFIIAVKEFLQKIS